MYTAYIIIDRVSGEPAQAKAYTTVGDAKRALKYHHKHNYEQYAIAKIQAAPEVLLVSDKDGKWTEVLA